MKHVDIFCNLHFIVVCVFCGIIKCFYFFSSQTRKPLLVQVQLNIYNFSALLFLLFLFVSLALAARPIICNAFFFAFRTQKGGSLCQAFLAETVETGNRNRCMIEAAHVLRIKFRAFPKRVGPRIQSVDYFGTSEHY